MKYIVGLGNPGEEYKKTRHNTGRIILDIIRKKIDADDFEFNKKINALVSEGKIGKEKVMLIEPETFMNKSGLSLKTLITSKKKAEDLVVIYDDLDLPIGKMKISFNRGTGGHKGLESVAKQIKTLEFARFRVGISPKTPSGKTKKPSGENVVAKHILSSFKDPEMLELKQIGKNAFEALEVFVKEGVEMAMTKHNG
ncbi:MAG: aminoacyl-tRNA hydrolase [bacterium]